MSHLRILFVDDDNIQRERFQDAISDWNAANAPKTFDPVILETSDAAAEALKHSRFDCALFDLKLEKGEAHAPNLTGNQLALEGLDEFGIPVGIISGFIEDVSEEVEARPLLRTFRKVPGAFDEAVGWLGGLWDMMEVLAATRRRIRRSGAEIFARRVWPRWDRFRELSADGDAQIEAVVTRQYAGHIAELLGIDGVGNPDWHPVESYIHPALQDGRAHTGDIFRLDGDLWVVLSPPCDMAADVEDVLLAKCMPDLDPVWSNKVAQLRAALAAGEVSANLRRYFSDLTNQNLEVSKHFLPPLDGHPLRVDFKRLATRPLAELTAALGERVASISPVFLTNLTQRFGAYISRTGQPNIGVEHFGRGVPAEPVAAAEAGVA